MTFHRTNYIEHVVFNRHLRVGTVLKILCSLIRMCVVYGVRPAAPSYPIDRTAVIARLLV